MNSVQNPAYQAGMEARFAIAARHSRMVRVLRIAVPAVVALALAVIIAISIFNPFRMLLPKLPLDVGNLVVSGTKITMEAPHLSGYTPDRRPYEVWAKTATQDVTDPDHLDLKTLRAKVRMEDQSIVTLDARKGLMNTKDQLLDLHDDIFLQTSTGYEARLSQAFVDMGKGTVNSDEHVDVKLTNGTLSSDRLRITGGGEVVRFEGNVVMNLDKLPAADAPDPSAIASAASETPARQNRRPAHRRQDAVGIPQDRQPEMTFMKLFAFRRTKIGPAGLVCTAALALGMIAAGEAGAQSAVQGVPNAMQGFSQNRDQPIQIEAATLEMRDKKKEATFSGNVKVVQGDTTMTSKKLVVFYDTASPPAASGANTKAAAKSAPIPSATPGPGGSSSIRRLEAQGNVVVTQKDQIVTGETAVFDTKTNLVTMLGGVVLTQGKNVLRGDRLMVDMTTGVSRVESDSGRVQGLFQSSGQGGPVIPGTAPGADGASKQK